jgi:cell division control protein 6
MRSPGILTIKVYKLVFKYILLGDEERRLRKYYVIDLEFRALLYFRPPLSIIYTIKLKLWLNNRLNYLYAKMIEEYRIFKDESKLSPEYIPKRIPHRENELDKLKSFFRMVLHDPKRNSQQVFIIGPVGSGKTLLSKKFIQYVESHYVINDVRLKTYYTNCRVNRVFGSILNSILSSIGHSFPNRGFSLDEIVQYFISKLGEEKIHVIVIFDEFDALVSHEGIEPLYIITRLREMAIDRQILSSIIISKSFSYLDKADPSILSSIQKNIIKLESYNESQLKDILYDRVLIAFEEDTVENETLDLISKLASKYGDARYAIELLQLSGRIAEFRGERKVRPEHVREAKLQLPPQIRKEELNYLDEHEKIILLSLAKLLKEQLEDRITLKILEEEYKIMCKKYGKEALKHTQFWLRVKNLAQREFIDSKVLQADPRGRTTVISLLNIPAEQLYDEIKERLEYG